MWNTLRLTFGHRSVVSVVGGVLALAAASQVSLPWSPVPLTLQTFVIFLIGLTYTPQQGFLTVAAWLWMAALGAPVLSGYVGGLHYLFGSTGGYLMGMVFAAYAMAWLRDVGDVYSYLGYVALAFVGSLVIFACGYVWLASFVGTNAAFQAGVVPFVGGDIVKVVFAGGLAKFYQGRLLR